MSARTELVLEHARLRVGPVEDGELAPAEVLGRREPKDRRRDPLRLVALVGGAVPRDLPAAVPLGEQVLAVRRGIVRDDRVRGVEDCLGGAEVLLEEHDRRVGKVLLELEDVAHVRGAEPVDALVRVADHADVPVLLGEEPRDLVLGQVRVLVLVDEDVVEPLAIVLEHVRAAAQQPHRVGEQVVEVHRVRSLQAPLVERVEIRDAPAVGITVAETVLARTGRGPAGPIWPPRSATRPPSAEACAGRAPRRP